MLEEERRFNWIYFYLDATKWGLLNEVTEGNHEQVFTIQETTDALNNWWMKNLRSNLDLQKWLHDKQSHGCTFYPQMRTDLHYIYDLEAELWGANWNLYCDRQKTDNGVYFEPFRLVLLFYLIERQLKVFLSFLRYYDYNRDDTSHSKLSKAAFKAFFTEAQMSHWLPYPFNLTALTNRIKRGDSAHFRHESYTYLGNHFSVVGKSHYSEVLASTLHQTAKWQRKRHTDQKTGKRPRKGSIEGCFFDALWHYSESYRYRIPFGSSYVRKFPFHWGLNVRWIGTLFISICEAWMFSLSPAEIQACWSDYRQISTSPILQNVQSHRWNTIYASRPQDLF